MKFGPCLEKKCSACCEPVRVRRFFPDEKIPEDENGQKIWTNPRIIVSADNPDKKLKAFDCNKLNKDIGKCSDYGKHPEICKNSSCIVEGSSVSVDEQYRRNIDEKFIEIK